MREILFRAKRIDNGEWVEGQYAYILNSKTENGEPIKHFICNGTNVFNCEVDPETLCQYTGLKDKNGNRIWENDVVSFIDVSSTDSGYWERDCAGIVTWDCEYACFCVSERLSSESWEVLQDCAVVGNIFDNPYLLKED